jgi:hypothetical protein
VSILPNHVTSKASDIIISRMAEPPSLQELSEEILI